MEKYENRSLDIDIQKREKSYNRDKEKDVKKR